MLEELLVREICDRILQLFENAKLLPAEPLRVYYRVDNDCSMLYHIVEKYESCIEKTIKAPFHKFGLKETRQNMILESTHDLQDAKIYFKVYLLPDELEKLVLV